MVLLLKAPLKSPAPLTVRCGSFAIEFPAWGSGSDSLSRFSELFSEIYSIEADSEQEAGKVTLRFRQVPQAHSAMCL